MASKKNKNKLRGPQPTTITPIPSKRDEKKHAKNGQPVRETIESLVIAFVMAFLFRTFQAEAFVIPTGSMAPTLMGRHEDVTCSECGQRYRVSDSLPDHEYLEQEARDRNTLPQTLLAGQQCIAGQCPNCRYTMPFVHDPKLPGGRNAKNQNAYPGDRIVVNKYLYSFTDPKRWDVIVFKYPGDAYRNYIKRLVGLPGETLRIQNGDLYVKSGESDFAIARKPGDKVLAMRQLVYDTDHQPATLWKSGYPLRWGDAENGWQSNESVEGELVKQTFDVDTSALPVWLRYSHIPPDAIAWQTAMENSKQRFPPKPRLVTDFNAYNSAVKRIELDRQGTLEVAPQNQGLHWVGDLILEADVEVKSDRGQFMLELVESGRRFRCTIDVSTGEATLSAIPFGQTSPVTGFAPTAKTSVKRSGRHELRFANVDDQLLLWVDGSQIEFDAPTQYSPEELFGATGRRLPQADEENPGDLSPAAVGAQELNASINRLSVWRDIYYIADKNTPDDRKDNRDSGLVSDFLVVNVDGQLGVETARGPVPLSEVLEDPELWYAFEARQIKEFELDEDLFFVMGDNSAASSDARLWAMGNGDATGIPGGAYLERQLLTGKAVCVYWPHSFSRVPGVGVPFPLFPNFGDMRLIR